MLENGSLEVAQRGTGLDTQLVREPPPHRIARSEGLALSPRAVQREHALSPKPLTKWMVGDQPFQLEHQRLVVAARELGVDAVLERIDTCLRELRRPPLQVRTERHTAERVATPES